MGSEPLSGFIIIFQIESEKPVFSFKTRFFAGFSFFYFKKMNMNSGILFKKELLFIFRIPVLNFKNPIKAFLV